MDKSSLRSQMASLGPVQPRVSKQVAEHIRGWMAAQLPGTVTYFVAMDDEIDLSPVVKALPGWRWLLPRVEADGTLSFLDRALPLETHRYGMDQPVDGGPRIPFGEIDLYLVPGLAFDRMGGRLGRGMGFYDRALSDRRSDAVAVGVTIDARILSEVPMTVSDIPMDFLVSETGLVAAGSG